MIRIEKETVYGLGEAIRGMRNPMNSWDKSDSFFGCGFSNTYPTCGESCNNACEWVVGPDDLSLMQKLVRAGSDHSKFMRMITVYCDITAPLYWWKEFDTYKVGTVANSCSTMHKIHAKELTRDDFSHEHLNAFNLNLLDMVINNLNVDRNFFLETKDKCYWEQMIQMLPSSYNQKRTVMLNYAVLRNMYHARKNHKLDEWRTFCEWITTLPYSELITEGGN